MRYIPDEILLAIVLEINSIRDLRTFRLVCCRWARLAFPIIARHLVMLNTSESIEGLISLLRQPPASGTFTKELTIYHGVWPVCSRAAFEVHPLLLGGKDKWVAPGTESKAAIQTAFDAYRQFLRAENNKSEVWNHQHLSTILQLLPHLRTLSIAPMKRWAWRPKAQPQLLALVKRIWLCPMHSAYTDGLLLRVLPTLNQFPQLTRLDVAGTIQPFSLCKKVDHIIYLRIELLEVPRHEPKSVIATLSAFPSLQDLSLRLRYPEGVACIPLGSLYLPKLKSLHVMNMCVALKDLTGFFERHRFPCVEINSDNNGMISFRT